MAEAVACVEEAVQVGAVCGAVRAAGWRVYIVEKCVCDGVDVEKVGTRIPKQTTTTTSWQAAHALVMSRARAMAARSVQRWWAGRAVRAHAKTVLKEVSGSGLVGLKVKRIAACSRFMRAWVLQRRAERAHEVEVAAKKEEVRPLPQAWSPPINQPVNRIAAPRCSWARSCARAW